MVIFLPIDFSNYTRRGCCQDKLENGFHSTCMYTTYLPSYLSSLEPCLPSRGF